MKTKTPWSGSRIISVVIAGISLLTTLFGLNWLLAGMGLIRQGNSNPKDIAGIGGLFLEIVGSGLLAVGGVMTLLFVGLYISTTRRLRRGLPLAPDGSDALNQVVPTKPTP